MILMWTVARFLACFCIIVLTRSDIMTQSVLPPPNESYLSISIKKLLESIHPYVAKNKGSYVFSPYGLSHAMNVLFLGTVGETKSEIRKVIFNGMREHLVGAHEGLISLNSRRNQSLQVQITSLIAINSNVDVLPSYQKAVTKIKGQYVKLDFTEKTAADVINEYVATGTNGFIPIFLNTNYKFSPPSELINAIALRLSWDAFHNAFRQALPFTNIERQVKYVTMLTLEGTFGFLKSNFASTIRLPYGDQYYIYIILPDTPDMLTKVEENIFKSFDSNVYGMRDKFLQVTIPKFKLDTFHNLNEAVSGIGVRKVFSRINADLREITKSRDFALGEVLQRAVVDFGYENNIPFGKPNIVQQSEVFLVDQPFFFVIRTEAHEVNLFRGRVANID